MTEPSFSPSWFAGSSALADLSSSTRSCQTLTLSLEEGEPAQSMCLEVFSTTQVRDLRFLHCFAMSSKGRVPASQIKASAELKFSCSYAFG